MMNYVGGYVNEVTSPLPVDTESGDCVRVPDLGLCRVVRGTYVRGMYYYSVYGL